MARGTGTRNQILETAVKLASREGLQGLSIGLLAKAVGMSKSGLFAHVSSKDNLKLMVLSKTADEFTQKVLSKSFKGVPRGLPRVRALFENWVCYLNDSSELPCARIMISTSVELDEQPGPIRDAAQKVIRDLIDNLERAAKLAVDEGHFRKDLDVKWFAWVWYSYVLGFNQFQVMLESPDAEKHLRDSFEMLIEMAKRKP